LWPSSPTTFANLRHRPNFALHRPIHPYCGYRPNHFPTIPNVDSAPIRFPGFAYRRRDSATRNCRRSDPDSSSVYPVGRWLGCLDVAARSSTCPVAPWPDYSGVAVRNSVCPAGWCSGVHIAPASIPVGFLPSRTGVLVNVPVVPRVHVTTRIFTRVGISIRAG
jgi:hypothetical protein